MRYYGERSAVIRKSGSHFDHSRPKRIIGCIRYCLATINSKAARPARLCPIGTFVASPTATVPAASFDDEVLWLNACLPNREVNCGWPYVLNATSGREGNTGSA